MCEDEGCARSYKMGGYLRAQGLTDERTFRITIFTQAHGPLPGFASSLECPSKIFSLGPPPLILKNCVGCHRRYYHNYIVHKGDSFRTYYPGYSLSLIQINEHVYVERAVCESFATMMSTAWYALSACPFRRNSVVIPGFLQPIAPGTTPFPQNVRPTSRLIGLTWNLTSTTCGTHSFYTLCLTDTKNAGKP